MKRSVILSAIFFGSLFYLPAKAQVSIHFGFNIPARPVYAPAPPPQPVIVDDDDDYYDNDDDYYYLPEVEAYYSVPRHCYYYQNDGRWVSSAYLPGAYRNYDWRSARRFEVRASRPFFNHDYYRNKWGGNYYRGWDWSRRNDGYARRDNDNRWNNQGYDRWNGNRNGWNRPDNDNRGNWNRQNDGYRDGNNNWNAQPRNNNWQQPQPDRRNGNDDRGVRGWGRRDNPGFANQLAGNGNVPTARGARF
ncbi:hypothetical protein [Mucilaginibacter sp. 44-25]|uniref:hypothetical protein n=1 Tax=Mucilaginibacter sp. 44-25 TaxID=1895794 RepID=UPI00095DFFFC|nr:hypothetical protein [Mucilaginibacter sp. 44-25]OJW18208.1 MAG: hypothetical protein BGO48_16745 [Mucilaginibacter sp. 44-25]